MSQDPERRDCQYSDAGPFQASDSGNRNGEHGHHKSGWISNVCCRSKKWHGPPVSMEKANESYMIFFQGGASNEDLGGTASLCIQPGTVR